MFRVITDAERVMKESASLPKLSNLPGGASLCVVYNSNMSVEDAFSLADAMRAFNGPVSRIAAKSGVTVEQTKFFIAGMYAGESGYTDCLVGSSEGTDTALEITDGKKLRIYADFSSLLGGGSLESSENKEDSKPAGEPVAATKAVSETKPVEEPSVQPSVPEASMQTGDESDSQESAFANVDSAPVKKRKPRVTKSKNITDPGGNVYRTIGECWKELDVSKAVWYANEKAGMSREENVAFFYYKKYGKESVTGETAEDTEPEKPVEEGFMNAPSEISSEDTAEDGLSLKLPIPDGDFQFTPTVKKPVKKIEAETSEVEESKLEIMMMLIKKYDHKNKSRTYDACSDKIYYVCAHCDNKTNLGVMLETLVKEHSTDLFEIIAPHFDEFYSIFHETIVG